MRFRDYLFQRRQVIAAFSVFCVLLGATFALYRLPLGAVGYPALLGAVFAGVFTVVDYTKVRAKYERLKLLEGRELYAKKDLPASDGPIEEQYRELIAELQTRLQQQAAAADARYTDMTDYYAAWAHQIKTPIAAMRLRLADEDTALARQIGGDLSRIEQYVEMVLVFLRLDADTSDFVFKSYDLESIVRQAVRKFSGEFIGRGLRLSLSPIECSVVTDEKWLLFVIEQVLSNALKYTRQGGITIGFTGRTLFIRDTGIGIAPEDLPRIFEKGYTGYNGREDKKATGIGLYLCRRICGQLGVEIMAESKPDEGTTICLTLPDTQPVKD